MRRIEKAIYRRARGGRKGDWVGEVCFSDDGDVARFRRFPILLLLLLVAIETCFAQQSAEVQSDPQARVEAPDRSVNAVDPDPEKQKQDAAGQSRTAQPYSSWAPQRSQAQKTALDYPERASNWGHKHPQTNSAALLNTPHGKWILPAKPSYPVATKPQTRIGYPRTTTPGNFVSAQPRTTTLPAVATAGPVAGPRNLQFAAGGPDGNPFAFDPMRKLSKTRFPHRAQHAQADSYCHARALSPETARRLCMKPQKKTILSTR
jgi:hypothetical protein